MRRCAWVDNGVPRPAGLGEWALARRILVLATQELARRDPLTLRGRGMGLGMGSGSGFWGRGSDEELASGWNCRGGGVGYGCGAELRVPPKPSQGPRPRITLGLT